jgi:hypothetical protein
LLQKGKKYKYINNQFHGCHERVNVEMLNYLDCWVGVGMTHQKPMEFFKLGIIIVIVISHSNVIPSLNFRK